MTEDLPVTSRNIQDIRRGDIVTFVPEARANRVRVLVDAVTVGNVGLAFIHGVRCTAEGAIDSQARRQAWPVRSGATVEVSA